MINQNKLLSENNLLNLDTKGLSDWLALFFPEVRKALVEGMRADTLMKIGLKTDEICTILGIERNSVPLKVALPLLTKASLEHEEEMLEVWAKLLASTLKSSSPVHIRYADILSQIGAYEAHFLKEVYEYQNEKCKGDVSSQFGVGMLTKKIKDIIAKQDLVSYVTVGQIGGVQAEPESTKEEDDFPPLYEFKYDGTPEMLNSLDLMKSLNLLEYELFVDRACGTAFLTAFGYRLLDCLEHPNR